MKFVTKQDFSAYAKRGEPVPGYFFTDTIAFREAREDFLGLAALTLLFFGIVLLLWK